MESDFDEGAYTKKCSGGFLITDFFFDVGVDGHGGREN